MSDMCNYEIITSNRSKTKYLQAIRSNLCARGLIADGQSNKKPLWKFDNHVLASRECVNVEVCMCVRHSSNNPLARLSS